MSGVRIGPELHQWCQNIEDKTVKNMFSKILVQVWTGQNDTSLESKQFTSLTI